MLFVCLVTTFLCRVARSCIKSYSPLLLLSTRNDFLSMKILTKEEEQAHYKCEETDTVFNPLSSRFPVQLSPVVSEEASQVSPLALQVLQAQPEDIQLSELLHCH